MGKGKRSPSCSDFCCISEQQNFDCCTNRHCASLCAKHESSKEITHSSKMEKHTNKSSTDLQLEGLKLKAQLTLPKMCLVNGDQEDLSSKPKGMKIISELLNTE